jgi:anaerobic magnesium-protoporphyrin IX monomethyl ester cyclase
MDYLLVDSIFDDEKDMSESHGRFVPYGLLILDKVLNDRGYKGKIILNNDEFNTFMEESNKNGDAVKLIGITSSTWTRFDAISKIKKLRRQVPEALIVAGGFHFGNCADDSIRNIPELDVVVRGEGEEVIINLMKLSNNEIDIKNIQGITYRGYNGEPIEQGPRQIVNNLPDLDFMEYNYTRELFTQNILHPSMPIPSMNILAGRGCPFGCIFCSVSRTKHRSFPVDQILDHIERITNKFNIAGVKFWDDSLTINESYVYELCQKIKQRNLKIYWFCDSRADINFDLIPLMYSAGCRFISVGLETGSKKIQKIVGKKVSNEQICLFAAKCHEVGIRPFIFLMASFPNEDLEDLKETIAIAKELCSKYKAIASSLQIATILPGTELEKIARERGILQPGFSWTDPYYNSVNLKYGQVPYIPIYIEGITPEDLRKANILMLINYGVSFSWKTFAKEAWENLWGIDRSWKEKIFVGSNVMICKIKEMLLRS